MPQIVIVTDPVDQTVGTVVFRERIAISDLESDHYSNQLVERVGWAVLDADELEHHSRQLTAPLLEQRAGRAAR